MKNLTIKKYHSNLEIFKDEMAFLFQMITLAVTPFQSRSFI
jgi:hypothetical protein